MAQLKSAIISKRQCPNFLYSSIVAYFWRFVKCFLLKILGNFFKKPNFNKISQNFHLTCSVCYTRCRCGYGRLYAGGNRTNHSSSEDTVHRKANAGACDRQRQSRAEQLRNYLLLRQAVYQYYQKHQRGRDRVYVIQGPYGSGH